jgi:hypothetical protein
MAVIQPQTFDPMLPRREEVDPAGVAFDFDRVTDTLYVHLFGHPRPAVNVDTGPYLDLRVDVQTEEVVGFQIESFLRRVIREHPALLDVAELAGVPADEVAEIRRSLPHATRQRAAVGAVFDNLAALKYPPEEVTPS